MAAPMRSSSQEAGHRARVADPRTGNATAKPDIPSSTTPTASASAAITTNPPASSNFEYDDNEWDIGIGDLIIDLDADIEKTNDQQPAIAMAANAGGPQAAKAAATAKMAIEHSATVDKGLKMKIKRMKPGTKTSEAKHEIVKSNELNGNADQNELKNASLSNAAPSGKHGLGNNATSTSSSSAPSSNNSGNSKRGSSSHRRDKVRDKHGSSSGSSSILSTTATPMSSEKNSGQKVVQQQTSGAVTINVAEMNGMVRVSVPQTGPPRSVFPASTGPGPPQSASSGPSPGPPPSPAAATAQGSAAKPEQAKVAASAGSQTNNTTIENTSPSPPPTKKIKSDTNKEVSDVCIGTSVGTITEPDCLGPCEPGTSVTLEGIVWHETEGGVLVVNVTWRGKTYVGTLLDCTRHDWAPPRFCDSPTSDLDNRTPKGRGKRGRSGASTPSTPTPSTDLSNSTETRSSVHSKLRNGGAGGVKGRRGAASNGSGPSTAPSSPTPFVPPRPEPSNKRKSRAGDEEPQTPPGKKNKIVIPPPIPTSTAPCVSPPPSPVLLECPEPNCSKKYKHINGLKYHQSHAHGSVDDEDTKDVTSMSENDESNIEAPSPATPVKSPPDKSQDSPMKKEPQELPMMLRAMEVSSQPATPISTPPSPATPQSMQDIGNGAASPTVPLMDAKSVVKPGVLRYTPTEEFPVGVFSGKTVTPISGPAVLPPSAVRNVPALDQPIAQNEPQQQNNAQLQSFTNQLQSQQQFAPQPPPPTLMIPPQTNASSQMNSQQMSPQQPPQSPQNGQQTSKLTQPATTTPFKVKPTSSLMPDEKNKQPNVVTNKSQTFKKKNRKSPAGSPHPPEQPVFGVEQSARDEVQSPAYSDISDDGAPVIEADLGDKNKSTDKKTDSAQSMPHMPQYGMYPFYGQTQYLVPQVQQSGDAKSNKETDKNVEKPVEKEAKKDGPEYPQKIMPQQHYYSYGYMPGYPYNMDPNFGGVPMVQDDKIKEERVKESPSPIIDQPLKANAPIPNPIQVPTPGKVKTEPMKDKHQNENHQILKESIEIKSQMNPYMYSRSQQQQQQQQSSHHAQREEDVRRFYVFDQRRKESQQPPEQHKSTPSKVPPPRSPSLKHKDSKSEEKKDKDNKNEGVKPTMETQGPPPPPTSQYAYIHPSYMQSAHYGALPFDPNHPMYRGIMVPGPYSGNPYLHAAQMPRYHAPEDLSRAPPPPTKALEMLQHHAQYYSSHKIHELQERAIKSPTPKTSVASSSPSTNSVQTPVSVQSPMSAPPTSQANVMAPGQRDGKMTPQDGGKDSRSPPPQRHVHTHHHTHVGLGYPMYPAPYGAAVLASQQAAAVTVINPYPTK